MIERLLIANRGEIARRITRTCRSLGIESVAVFSDADEDGAFVHEADLAVGIGGQSPAESYLRVDAILAAARTAGADAVHPGYGFLAENADFAQAVLDAGLLFIGPSPEAISIMGSKLESKRRMAAAGVPLLPSAELASLEPADLRAKATEVGYPLLIKASAGGGGRGMRIVRSEGELVEAATAASREAVSAFGDGTIYAERYVSPSRHVEVQIFGDAAGSVVHFHERECSIQRRHQKIIEEAPSASIDDETRSALHAAAVAAGEAIAYTNAGTVEFLLAPGHDDRPAEFFFLEVNTRLQVEHPVTEAVLGVDLVELQLEVASGGSVPAQDMIGPVKGHAIEARLYAEDPTADYRPSTGVVHAFHVPGDVRVDGAIEGAGEVSQFYDPMIAKVIAHGSTRGVAARRLAASLAGTTIDGIVTNRDLLVRTLRHDEFLGDRGDSEFLERHDAAVLGRPLVEGHEQRVHVAAAALAVQHVNRGHDPHTGQVASGFRNVVTSPQRLSFAVGDTEQAADYLFLRGRLAHLSVDGNSLDDPIVHSVTSDRVDLSVAGVRRLHTVRHHGQLISVTTSTGSTVLRLIERFVEPDALVDPGSTIASMPGTIVDVRVAEGDEVSVGDVLVVMEAMKMELAITAARDGVVTSLAVGPGDTVEAGSVLAVVDVGEA